MRRQNNIDNPKHLVNNGIILCCLSVVGGVLFQLNSLTDGQISLVGELS
jgi:hypothetical protein